MTTTPPRTATRLCDLRTTLDVLADWSSSDWGEVAQAASRVTLLVWEELGRQRLFEELPPHDQAAVYYALALGSRIQSEPPNDVADDRPLVVELGSEIAHFAAWCQPPGALPWPEARPDRAQQGTDAVQLRRRLLALPPSWQHETVERLIPLRRCGRDVGSPAEPLALDTLLRHAEEQAGLNHQPPAPGQRASGLESGARGQDVVARLGRLPEGWQTEAVRRIAAGVVPLSAVSDAAISINIVRSFGVRVAWNARSPYTSGAPTVR